MPGTLLSHQAIVLPLKLWWPRRFSGLALCIGSMAPDFEFIGRMTDDWLFSHTLSAQVWFTIPLTMALVWIVTQLLIPTLLPYVREMPTLRLHDLAALEPPDGARAWAGVAVSALLGGLSHLFLDGMTHGGHSGWMVPLFPVLRTMVPQIGGPVPLFDALQVWLSIILGFASFLMWRRIASKRLLWHWKQRSVEPQRIMPRRTGMRLLAIYLIAAIQGVLIGLVHHRTVGTKNLEAALLFGAIDLTFCVVVISALAIRWLRDRAPMPRTRFHGRDLSLIDP